MNTCAHVQLLELKLLFAKFYRLAKNTYRRVDSQTEIDKFLGIAGITLIYSVLQCLFTLTSQTQTYIHMSHPFSHDDTHRSPSTYKYRVVPKPEMSAFLY